MGYWNDPEDWLDKGPIKHLPRWHDSWYGNYNEEKWDDYNFFMSIPFLRTRVTANLNRERNDAYLDVYGMTYDDIVNPDHLQDQSYGDVVNFVSGNLRKLYRRCAERTAE